MENKIENLKNLFNYEKEIKNLKSIYNSDRNLLFNTTCNNLKTSAINGTVYYLIIRLILRRKLISLFALGYPIGMALRNSTDEVLQKLNLE